MFWEEIEEICHLCVMAMEKTHSFVGLNLDNGYVSVHIKDKEDSDNFDGNYIIFPQSEILKEESEKTCEAVKAHLERLLKEDKTNE